MKQKNSRLKQMTVRAIILGAVTFTGCADWQSTPRYSDAHYGVAVKHMIANQTLYPEHTHEPRQVFGLDGQKSESTIRAYRAPSSDLRQGKKRVAVGLSQNSSGSSD